MRQIVILSVCIACKGHGQEVFQQNPSINSLGSTHAERQQQFFLLGDADSFAEVEVSDDHQISVSKAFSPLRNLAQIFFALNPVPALGLNPASVPNFRDLGQTPCTHGIIRPGLLLRSATPANISQDDSAALSGIHTILDLRLECDAQKDPGPRRLASVTQHVPLLSEAKMKKAIGRRAYKKPLLFSKLLVLSILKKISPSRRLKSRLEAAREKPLCKMLDTVSLADIYEFILTESSEELVEAFELCASEAALPMLVHCTHGKDRTGVLIALLLVACGVSENHIIQDYVHSHEYGCSLESRAAMRASFPERVQRYLRPDLLDEWCEAPEEQISEFLRRTKHKYGSLIAYLDSIGVDEDLRRRVVAQLTESPENKNKR